MLQGMGRGVFLAPLRAPLPSVRPLDPLPVPCTARAGRGNDTPPHRTARSACADLTRTPPPGQRRARLASLPLRARAPLARTEPPRQHRMQCNATARLRRAWRARAPIGCPPAGSLLRRRAFQRARCPADLAHRSVSRARLEEETPLPRQPARFGCMHAAVLMMNPEHGQCHVWGA